MMNATVEGIHTPITLRQIRKRTIQILGVGILIRIAVYALLAADLRGAMMSGATIRLIEFSGFFEVLVTLVILGLATADRVETAAVSMIVSQVFFVVIGTLVPLFSAVVAIIAAAVLGHGLVYIATNYVVVGSLTYRLVSENTLLGANIVVQVSVLFAILVLSVALRYFFSALQEFATNAERNANLLRVGSEVGGVTAGMVDLDELLQRAVDYIRDRFAFYHVQIFMIDEAREHAVLVASTGELGRKLLERQHRLPVGSNSVIGRVTQAGEPVIASNTEVSDVHMRNELLPNTRAELALPIMRGDEVVGALDVQSTRSAAFMPGDVQALQIMANLLSAAIENARLFEGQQASIREIQRLYVEAEANLQEIQRLNSQLTQQTWQQYAQDQGRNQAGVVIQGNQIQRGGEWSPLLSRAGRAQAAMTEDREQNRAVAVPILLRGEVIGAMEIEPDARYSETDSVEMMRAVAERLAVSLDNARLFEEAQSSTVYEQQLNEIVGSFQSANSIDELLQITLSELSDLLGAEQGAIRLSAHVNGDGGGESS